MVEGNAEQLLKRLSRGLSQKSYKEIFASHRLLVDIGKEVIPLIRDQLLGQPWDEIKHSAQLNMLSGLLSVVNDIDEESAKKIGREIEQRGCDIAVSTRIKTILEFTLNEFESDVVLGVQIYYSKLLVQIPRIKRKMQKWMSCVPSSDLEKIERMYIIPASDSDYRGTYMPVLCNIMVEWIMPFSYYNPISWFFFLQIEKTLYHEIGHHVCNHTFGQDPDQEKEANQYAAKILAKSHPGLKLMVKLIKAIFVKNKKTLSQD